MGAGAGFSAAEARQGLHPCVRTTVTRLSGLCSKLLPAPPNAVRTRPDAAPSHQAPTFPQIPFGTHQANQGKKEAPRVP